MKIPSRPPPPPAPGGANEAKPATPEPQAKPEAKPQDGFSRAEQRTPQKFAGAFGSAPLPQQANADAARQIAHFGVEKFAANLLQRSMERLAQMSDAAGAMWRAMKLLEQANKGEVSESELQAMQELLEAFEHLIGEKDEDEGDSEDDDEPGDEDGDEG